MKSLSTKYKPKATQGPIPKANNKVPTPTNYTNQLILAVISVITVGIGGGIYLVSNLGAGPRDGFLLGWQKKTNLPIELVSATLEIKFVRIG